MRLGNQETVGEECGGVEGSYMVDVGFISWCGSMCMVSEKRMSGDQDLGNSYM